MAYDTPSFDNTFSSQAELTGDRLDALIEKGRLLSETETLDTPTGDAVERDGARYYPFDGDEPDESGFPDVRPISLWADQVDALYRGDSVLSDFYGADDMDPDTVRIQDDLDRQQAKIDLLHSHLREVVFRNVQLPFQLDVWLEQGAVHRHLLALVLADLGFKQAEEIAQARQKEIGTLIRHGRFDEADRVKNEARGVRTWMYAYLQEAVGFVSKLDDATVKEQLREYLTEYGIELCPDSDVVPWSNVTEARRDAAARAWLRYLAFGDGKTVTVTQEKRSQPYAYTDRLAKGGVVETTILSADRQVSITGSPLGDLPGRNGKGNGARASRGVRNVVPMRVWKAVDRPSRCGEARASVFLFRNTEIVRTRMAELFEPTVEQFASTLGTTMKFPVDRSVRYRLASAIYFATARGRHKGWALDASGLNVDEAHAIFDRVKAHHSFLQRYFWKVYLEMTGRSENALERTFLRTVKGLARLVSLIA